MGDQPVRPHSFSHHALRGAAPRSVSLESIAVLLAKICFEHYFFVLISLFRVSFRHLAIVAVSSSLSLSAGGSGPDRAQSIFSAR